MILTKKIKHGFELSDQLVKARKVAIFAIHNRELLSTKYVKHIGLNARFSVSILRKYGRNWKAKKVKNANLLISGHHIREKEGCIYFPPLRASIPFNIFHTKINSIELDNDFAYVSYTLEEPKLIIPKRKMGVDLNATSHCAVAAIKETGKILKLGKKAEHVHLKYKRIRRNLQKQGNYRAVKRIKRRESNIVKDVNHKVSRAIVDRALKERASISLENLRGVRKGRRFNKTFKHILNSWSFHQLQTFIAYKALLAGVPVSYVDPAYTSKVCSRCGTLGTRIDKQFKCPNGHVEHADVNAAFNIALPSPSIVRLQEERDSFKGLPESPKAQRGKAATLKS